MLSFENKSVVVTGAGSGIGRAIALAFAKRGAYVHVLERDEEAGRRTCELVRDQDGSGEAGFVRCDVESGASVDEAFRTVASHGALNVLVNNAGIGHVGNVTQTEEADLDRLYAVNVKGVYLCSRSAVKLMTREGAAGGAIVNMASIASLVGVADRFAYSMTKGAVLTMTYSLAVDFLSSGIRCNCVCPARVHTPFVDAYLDANYPGRQKEMFDKLSAYQPMGRMGTTEEVAATVLFLASEEASFITGQAIAVDGGVQVH